MHRPLGSYLVTMLSSGESKDEQRAASVKATTILLALCMSHEHFRVAPGGRHEILPWTMLSGLATDLDLGDSVLRKFRRQGSRA